MNCYNWRTTVRFREQTEKMNRKVTKIKKLRPSPNEEAWLLKEEFDRRRKLRLEQVREQESHFAFILVKEYQQRCCGQYNHLAEVEVKWHKENCTTKTEKAAVEGQQNPKGNKMKRKVGNMTPLRPSPNKEAQLLKQEFDRQKLILHQVKEQEEYIAYRLRKQYQHHHSDKHHLLAEVKVKWLKEQADKRNALESVGEGHQNEKENEPDWASLAGEKAAIKQKAEDRCHEALKELKFHGERWLEQDTRHIQAWLKTLTLEKKLALKIVGLLPPLQDPNEKILQKYRNKHNHN